MDDHASQYPSTVMVRPPAHPVSQLQGPFEESMLESAHNHPDQDVPLDPMARRNTLLDSPFYTRVIAGRWIQKPGEKYHPLWKLVAQVSFGIHLLAEGMARSEEDVMQILQAHVDEIDGFLERTTEDFDLAQEDIQERLRCLKLPLSHPQVFERMLEDRAFRNSIVEGNEKIEHIVMRTKSAMKDALKDVQKGFDSTSCLERYLHGLSRRWRRQQIEHEAVYVAMVGNVEGWRKAFMDLHLRGNKLAGLLRRMIDIIAEMQQKAGEVSRRMVHQARPTQSRQSSANVRQIEIKKPALPVSKFQSASSVRHLSQPTSATQLRSSSGIGDRHRPMEVMKPAIDEGVERDLPSRSSTVQDGAIRSHQQSTLRPDASSPSMSRPDASPALRPPVELPSVMELPPKEGSHALQKEPEKSSVPFELPAHVPPETLRQAPMSKQNRLSIGLGILGTDRKPSTSTPSATLVGLVQSPGTSLPSSLLTNSPAQTSEAETEYFSAMEQRSSHVGTSHDRSVTSKTGSELGSSSVPGTPPWASPVVKQVQQNRAELKRGAFSSHPPTLPPGSPPVRQALHSAGSPLRPRMSGRTPSHTSSIGTLGEPGPELSGSSPSASSLNLSQSGGTVANTVAHPSAVGDQAAIPKQGQTQNDTQSPKRVVVAEMEGSFPVYLEPKAYQAPAFVELEAPQQYFMLPPRPTKSTVQSPSEDTHERKGSPTSSSEPQPLAQVPDPKPVSRADIRLSLLLPYPAEPLVTDVLSTMSATPPPQIPPQSTPAGLQNTGSGASRPSTPSGPTRQSKSPLDTVASLIEQLSSTPPGSPIHQRSTSANSTNSALLDVRPTPHLYGPPSSAPPPPGPSGRPMASLTTDAHSIPQGERKRTSDNVHSPWRAFFTGQSSPAGSGPSVRSAKRASGDISRPSATAPAARDSGSSMMTSGGKDVLWFDAGNATTHKDKHFAGKEVKDPSVRVS